jgi:2,6-dihydroxypseudooxynicotine hydrolase
MSKKVAEQVIDQGIHRFLADGVHYRDLMDVRRQVPDWPSWASVWSRVASEAEARAQERLTEGARLTAGEELARAALYFHYGQFLLFDDLELKRKTHAQKVDAFKRAAVLLDPPLQRVEIPFEGVQMGAYFRVPRGKGPFPCVVLMGGLDTTKEDYLSVNNLCVQRGLATLAFDGPGQGETQFDMLWRRDYPRAVTAVLDFAEKIPEVDPTRIGIIGRSMGGFYAPNAAATDDRVKAAVAWGAMYHLRNIAEVPEHTLQGFMYVSGSQTVEQAKSFFECINLEGVADKIRCPLLVVHGGLDAITPLENATKLVQEARGVTETLIWDDSVHCCHDRSHIVRPAMADFMARNL